MSLISAHGALATCETLIAVALIQQTLEQLVLRPTTRAGGVWTWSVLSQDFHPRVRRLLQIFLGDVGFGCLLGVQLLAAIGLMFFSSAGLNALLFLCAFLITARFRGTFNGGSDYMTLLILFAVTVARIWPQLTEAALWYIAIQTGLSYFVAGLVKIKERTWRTGEELSIISRGSIYNLPQNFLPKSRPALFAIAWTILTFEILFPLSFLSPVASIVFLALGLCFHLGVAWLFGLNRFLFAWLASYPAVFFTSVYFAG